MTYCFSGRRLEVIIVPTSFLRPVIQPRPPVRADSGASSLRSWDELPPTHTMEGSWGGGRRGE